jgi:hypothetical protein
MIGALVAILIIFLIVRSRVFWLIVMGAMIYAAL